MNAAGLTLLKGFESCSLTAYWDSVGRVWTIGWGHTGPDVYEGLIWTQEQADAMLERDLVAFCNQVQRLVGVVLTPNQFSALVDFQYNTGALGSSPGLALINARQFEGAWDQHLCLYVDAGTPDEAGLTQRRQAEKALFFTT